MRTIALLVMLAVTACEGASGYSPDNPPPYGMSPFAAYQPPPMQTGYQTFTMPSGRMVSCTSIGSHTNCF